MKLKWSMFNIEYVNDNSNNIDIYNTRTRGIISLDQLSYSQINEYINNEMQGKIDDGDSESMARLYHDGYLAIDNEWTDFIKQRKESYNQLTNKFLFYFIPSWQCNFRCTYCHFYKNIDMQGSMSKDHSKKTAEYLIQYIRHLYGENQKVVELTIVLYGGEPLLMREQNLTFLSTLQELKRMLKFELKLSLSIITNGYLFDEEAYATYSAFNLVGIQVTLDGEADFHNNKRFHVNASIDTYSKIIDNLKKAMQYKGLHITLRINVDEGNVDNIPCLLKRLHQEGFNHNISLSISPIFSNTNVEGATHKKRVLEKYMNIFEVATSLNYPFTFPTTNCSVHSKEFLAVAINGEVYPCPSMSSSQIKQINNIHQSINIMDRFTQLPVFCKGCKWAPLCGGGCEYQNIKENEQVCLSSMYDLMVKAYVLHYNVMNRLIGG